MKFRSILLLASAFLATAPPASAAPLYSENFDSDPGYVVAKGPDDDNISSVGFGAGGSKAPYITFGNYGGTSQYLPNATAQGALAIGSSADPINGKSRSRSYVTVVDTSSASVGQYRVSFDVSDFQCAGENTALLFHLFEGRGTERGFVDFQLTSQTTLPDLARTRPVITTGKGATAWQILIDNEIRKDGKFSLSFGLGECGRPGDYLALVWSQAKRGGAAVIPSMTVDNVEVSMIPAPAEKSSTQVVPASPLGQAGSAWKLRSDFSDEFDSGGIDPRKWNNNPGSWGAWSWDEDNSVQAAGKLRLEMVHDPHTRNGTKLFYKSGILKSHQQMTYGYYEARIKGCSLFPGACPAFWIYSDGRKFSGEVRYCEIDFVEIGMNEINRETKVREPITTLDLNLHLRLADKNGEVRWLRPNSDPDLCAHAWTAPWDPRDGFHVYACDVSKETITWFIDGEKVATQANQYWHEPMNLALSLGLRHPHIGWVGQEMKPVPQAATAEGFPTSMEVDWVRVWERESTPAGK
jgi:beta-glucanase (GH16 family)